MEVVAARAGVAAGFGVAAGAHGRHAERDERVAQGRGFAGGEHEADLGKRDAQGAQELDQGAVVQRMARL